jgi:ATP/maltotriose-dependent transcriptional regulator MalT
VGRSFESRQIHPLTVISADSVDALLLQARGDTETAIARLRSVVQVTRRGDLLRWFVDFGSPMQRLLLQLERWTAPPDSYVTRVLAAFPVSTGPLEAAAPSRRESRASVVDALTRRELEVLQLLDARRSNKEIARLLHISCETVKKHTGNIYQKLQVGSRREAVSRAHGVGLLRIVPRSGDAEPHDSAAADECS